MPTIVVSPSVATYGGFVVDASAIGTLYSTRFTLAAFEEEARLEVRRVLRDERGQIIGVVDQSPDVEEIVAELKAEFRRHAERVETQNAKTQAAMLRAATPPARSAASVARYHQLSAR
jgi:hypothetical protein